MVRDGSQPIYKEPDPPSFAGLFEDSDALSFLSKRARIAEIGESHEEDCIMRRA